MRKSITVPVSLLLALSVAMPVVGAETEVFDAEATHLAERSIPLPAGLSPEMQQVVLERQIAPVPPAPQDVETWLELQSLFDAPGEELGRQAAEANNVTYEEVVIDGVPAFVVTPAKTDPRWDDHVFMHTHGGAWVFGGGESALREAVWAAVGLGAEVVSVDYRQPPLHPFPAALEDTVAVWTEITAETDSTKTAIFGTSAGGNIALATTVKLGAMNADLPGAVFAGTPATDLENISDSWHTLQGLDPLGARDGVVAGAFDLYVGDADPSDPLLSPVNADLEGFPPTVLISGTRDLLLSDTVRMHRALRDAGVEADLHVYDGQSHGDYMQNLLTPVPEAEDAQRELYEFFDRHLG